MAAEVIGREGELGSIEAFLARAEDGPSALVLSGEAGIGKTVLWQAGVEEARGSASVLLCRGVEAEAALSFTGLSELLGDRLEQVASSLATPRRRALEVALLLVEPGETAPDPHAIGLAVLDVLRALSQLGPVLVAVDDVQWLDHASAGALQIAFRRLREEPIGLLATLRLGPELASPVELEHSFPNERLERLTVGPLTLGAVHRLLEKQLGLELTRPELVRVQDATAGNPFFALELGRELARTNTRPAPGQPLRVPESLSELLGGRLARLPGETLDVLLLVAALARPSIDLVAATYGGHEPVLAALETAAQEAVVELDNGSVRFAHPLLGSICYERAPLWKRRAVHGALAASVTDVEERARHLALAAEGPDAVAASYLDAASDRAAGRGAPGPAAELSTLAAELTVDDPALARARRFRAAKLHRLAGDVEQAGAVLERLLAESPPGLERSDVLFELAVTQLGSIRLQIERCDAALAEAEDDDLRSARILAVRAGLHLVAVNAVVALTDARAAVVRAERARDPTVLAEVIAYAGRAENYHSEATPGLLERGVELEERLALDLEWNYSPSYVFARGLMRLGETDQARAALEGLEAKAAARGDEVSHVMVLWPLCVVEWIAGRWGRALDHAVAAHELTEQTQHVHARHWVGRAKALLESDLGLVEEARSTIDDVLADARVVAYEFSRITTVGVLGRLELALGNLEEAGDRLRELPGRLLAGGMNDPALPVWADAIETLIRLGELELARSYLDPHEANAERLGSPYANAGAMRCRGLLLAAEGDVSAAQEAFEHSLADAGRFPLEHARTLLGLGVVRRQAQQRKASRQALDQALTIFEELGARLWAERAREELGRISGRRASPDELTETERRVAELAARGRTNKEIAAELFMGVSTVEAHLSRVYRKLGVRRAGLGTHMAAAVDQSAPI
jgi:DNA-binding CsgD family transcriptional regulator